MNAQSTVSLTMFRSLNDDRIRIQTWTEEECNKNMRMNTNKHPFQQCTTLIIMCRSLNVEECKKHYFQQSTELSIICRSLNFEECKKHHFQQSTALIITCRSLNVEECKKNMKMNTNKKYF